MEYLESQATANPEQAEHYTELVNLFRKKLWHQVTLKLRAIVRLPFFLAGSRLIELHDKFVASISKHLSKQDYILFVVEASRQYPDARAALAALQSHEEEMKDDAQSKLLNRMAICRRKLELGLVDECKEIVREGKAIIDKFPGVMETVCQSSYYQAAFEYFKTKGDAVQYYTNCILYLTYTELASISSEDQRKLAYDVGLAALIGDHTYNFGELLQHPILKALGTKDTQWLVDMLFAFNNGDIVKFDALYKEKGGAVAELKKNKDFLDTKVRIMTLMDVFFKRGVESRNVTFGEVAKACQMKEDAVEMMLMKSFSLGVIKGLIDQVDQTVRIKWVQPRVLSLEQIGQIKGRLVDWSKAVDEMTVYVENNGADLIEVVHVK